MGEKSSGSPAEALAVDAARALAGNLTDVAAIVHRRLTEEIEPLRGDASLVDLLLASIESNLETFAQMVRYDVGTERTLTPPAAAEYARRLAQNGVDPGALLRAYRLGQETALVWCVEQLVAEPAPVGVAVEACQVLIHRAFRYVEAISSQVISEYDAERARWLANSNSVRSAMLGELLDGTVANTTAAETALGYRLRQHHVGAILWLDREGTPSDLRALEHVLTRIGKHLGTRGQPFFSPRDRSTAWGWLPFGRAPQPTTALDGALLADLDRLGARLALGTSSVGPDGFRSTHLEARRARELAVIAGKDGHRLTSFADPGVRAATLMMGDLDATRRMVNAVLGPLGADDEQAARLRETVRTFLATGGSYPETGERMNLHKNTVRYRLQRATEARGRPVDDDRLDVELALIACEWIGSAVLTGG